MALTLRLTETENLLLEKIAIDLSEKTQSGAIKMMIASWTARDSAFAQLQAINMDLESQLRSSIFRFLRRPLEHRVY